MNRRRFLTSASALTASHASSRWSYALGQIRPGQRLNKTFPLALAEPLRHQHPSEIADDLARYKAHGYTGIWIENDYLRWTLDKDPDQGFDGCWRLFNIFDFTHSKARSLYCDYLTGLSRLCSQHELDIWASFWVPLPNAEMWKYLREHRPEAIGRVTINGRQLETLCTCADGKGLPFLSEMIGLFLDQFPQVKGLKIATGDNGARICDETCPNAYGTTQADHAGNLFGTIDRAIQHPQRSARLMLYPWYWGDGFREKILNQLSSDYLVMTKMEENSRQILPGESNGDALFDDSIVSERPGPDFQLWPKRVGPSRIVDMVPIGSGIDDMFFNYPPYPGRIYRRLHMLRTFEVTRFLDYECGGHNAGSNEEAVAIFSQNPDCSEATLLKCVAQNLYRNPVAQTQAIQGWIDFDKGFGELPIGLGGTGTPEFTGRFGFAWPMCIATPLVPSAFAERDRKHDIFWFSPYNFFTPANAPRLQFHFTQVLTWWKRSRLSLQSADQIERKENSQRESVAVAAHCLGVRSALNWCAAASMSRHSSQVPSKWKHILQEELAYTEAFQSLLLQHPWVWANNCWHPMQIVLHQKQLGFTPKDTDPFVAKRRLLEKDLSDRS